MPKSKVSRKRMFRDFSFLKTRYVSNNGLKNLHRVRGEFCESNEISFSHLEFLLWTYDLEFFTISYASEEYGMNSVNLANRTIYPLMRRGFLYKHFDKLTPSAELEDHLFREETKYNYRVRYALTQKGRLLVQRFYHILD
jgi:hypothetical protein